MAGTTSQAVTVLLNRVSVDASVNADAVVSAVYDELRGMAHKYLLQERQHHTLNTTALVHEAYLKLVDQTQVTAKGRAYFFGAAARAMRQILVDHARRRTRLKRGGKERALSLDEQHIAVEAFASHLVALDEALNLLAERSPRQAQVVECRFFGGLKMDEIAEVLEVSERTALRDWQLAKAWLFIQLEEK